jgi:hypothetical protein
MVTSVDRQRCRCEVVADGLVARVRFAQIDWLQFCELNQLPFPADFPARPAMPAEAAA